jgi:hypothetical protein
MEPSVRSVATISRIAEGAVPRLTGFNPVRLFDFCRHSALLFREGLRNLGTYLILFAANLVRGAVLNGRPSFCRPCQFTKRRILTFITIPSAKNMKRTEDPP